VDFLRYDIGWFLQRDTFTAPEMAIGYGRRAFFLVHTFLFVFLTGHGLKT
jgi:hypothetical protein